MNLIKDNMSRLRKQATMYTVDQKWATTTFCHNFTMLVKLPNQILVARAANLPIYDKKPGSIFSCMLHNSNNNLKH